MLFDHDDDRKLTGDELDEYNAELRAGTIDDRVKVMKRRILLGQVD
jgi:hypothetical protein